MNLRRLKSKWMKFEKQCAGLCCESIPRPRGIYGGGGQFAIAFAVLLMCCGVGAQAPAGVTSSSGPEVSGVGGGDNRSVNDVSGGLLQRGGSYRIIFHIAILSTLPANASVVCKVGVTPQASRASGWMVAGLPVESASSMAVLSGSTATCVVRIPFAWTLPGGTDGVTLSYEVDAYSGVVGRSMLLRSSAQPAIHEPMPVSGAECKIDLPLAF
uniref:Uncharacterized protein n=1 Tax=mine drainage metagenome TaxID=410659 RepID=E6QIF9_9ZZZZ